MMSGTWSKLKKSLSLKSSGASASSSQLPPRDPIQSDSRSAVPRSPSSSTTSSASLSSRLSRTLSSGGRFSQKICAICLKNVRSGQGQAIFTAECSHTFHFSCIAKSVNHGNHLCPICRSKWKEIPFQLPALSSHDHDNDPIHWTRVPLIPAPLNPPPSDPFCYSDDESIDSPVDSTLPASSAPSVNVSIKALPEFPAVAAADSVSDFAVLVGLRAPTVNGQQVDRAPIDLVTILDVSGSMNGSKLFLLKRAVCFVIENLGPADRLSVVAFSTSANRVFPLRKMTEQGREEATAAVNSLLASGGTNIGEGIRMGKRVLEERRRKNPVTSIILLSDGKDTYNCESVYRVSASPALVWDYTSNSSTNRPRVFPIHTFGFGGDHDSAVMHRISDASGGTFSFIESVEAVQDSFARCIGGLLSVVARDLRLTITTSTASNIGSISSGRYENEISDQGFRGVINVGDLYADEDKDFLVHLSVPTWPIADETTRTPLVDIACSYKDTASENVVELEMVRVEIKRPRIVSQADSTASLEVDRQRNRLWIVEGIAKAKEMAELGNLEGAKALLTERRSTLVSSASAQAGDGLCSWLEAELVEIGERMASVEMYERSGRAYMLSGLSSHSWQRATTRGDSSTNSQPIMNGGGASAVGYNTPSMVTMVTRSQDLSACYQRDQQRGRKVYPNL
ncbi:hypothetical protein ABFX02_13G185000 [Erythranthe guttata]